MPKGYDIEKDWTTKAGLRAVVLRLNDRSTGRMMGVDLNHRNGYVGVPVGHPLFGVEYSQETDALRPPREDEQIGARGVMSMLTVAVGGLKSTPELVFDVHGSLTYSGKGDYPVESALWWFGFDCGHAGDHYDGGQPFDYVQDQCEGLAQQIVDKTVIEQIPHQPAEKPA